MSLLVQADRCRLYVLEWKKSYCVKLRYWFNTDATNTGGIGYL